MKKIILLCIILQCRVVFSQDEPPEVKNISSVYLWMIYPDSAKKYGIEGRVTVKVLVGLQGEVVKTGEMTGPEVFYDEVKRISMMLKFKPAKHGGKG
jgi:outer membrane biosynthesis protein TonB